MAFIHLISPRVNNDIYLRGMVYFSERRVTILRGEVCEVEARVRGSRAYDVCLARVEDSLFVNCDCPYFDDNGSTCKHIYATMLAAEKKGFLSGDDYHGKLTIEPYFPDEEFADNEDDLDEESSHSPSPFAGTRRRKRRSRPPVLPPTKPAWQVQLDTLQRAVSPGGERIRNKPFGAESWGAKRQILYVIEAAESIQTKQVFLAVPHRDRKQNGEWGKTKFENLNSNQIPWLADADDRRILSLLNGAQGAYRGTYYAAYDSYHSGSSACRYILPSIFAETLLPMTCRTGRCFLRREHDAELAPLAWDDGGPWSFTLDWSTTKDGKEYEIIGRLQRGNESLDLAQVTLVLPGLIFWADRVGLLSGDSDQRWLDHFRRTGAVRLPKEQKGAWLRPSFGCPTCHGCSCLKICRFVKSRRLHGHGCSSSVANGVSTLSKERLPSIMPAKSSARLHPVPSTRSRPTR